MDWGLRQVPQHHFQESFAFKRMSSGVPRSSTKNGAEHALHTQLWNQAGWLREGGKTSSWRRRQGSAPPPPPSSRWPLGCSAGWVASYLPACEHAPRHELFHQAICNQGWGLTPGDGAGAQVQAAAHIILFLINEQKPFPLPAGRGFGVLPPSIMGGEQKALLWSFKSTPAFKTD